MQTPPRKMSMEAQILRAITENSTIVNLYDEAGFRQTGVGFTIHMDKLPRAMRKAIEQDVSLLKGAASSYSSLVESAVTVRPSMGYGKEFDGSYVIKLLYLPDNKKLKAQEMLTENDQLRDDIFARAKESFELLKVNFRAERAGGVG